jgi:hypothetical protein
MKKSMGTKRVAKGVSAARIIRRLDDESLRLGARWCFRTSASRLNFVPYSYGEVNTNFSTRFCLTSYFCVYFGHHYPV